MTEPTHNQPALTGMELPEYHGRKPVSMKTALSGAGTRVTRPHSIGDRVVLVIEAKIKSAGHEDTDDGLVYAEKLKVLDLFELEHDQGSRLLGTVRSLYRTGEDAARGKRPISGEGVDLGDVGYTDGSGVVLTAAELAELRGDPIRAILSDQMTPAVVVYDDGHRDLWPDDYARDVPRPAVGYLLEDSAGNMVRVVSLLHHETGETIASADDIEGAAFEPPADVDDGDMVPGAEEADSDDETPDNVRELRPSGAVPDLPAEADPYAGDLGDDVEGWETPDPATAERLAASAETTAIEAALPTAADFEFVDCQIPELVGKLAGITDVDHARRLELAEKQGRGRALKPRAGALKALGFRVAQLTAQAQAAAQ